MEKCPSHIVLIAAARDWIIRTVAVKMKPCKCPVCGQTVKLYPRKLSSALAHFLIDIYNRTALRPPVERWINVSKELIVSSDHHITRDYSILRFWGLLESSPTEKNKWRITPAGVAFVEGHMVVPEKAYIYNNHCLRLSKTIIDIKKAVGSRFDLLEMLKTRSHE